MGAVFSHTKGFTTIPELLPSLAFHAVFTALGLFCIIRSLPKKAEESGEQKAESPNEQA